MQSIAEDFLAESGALGDLLSTLADEQWFISTPAVGWDVRDSVAHIAVGNELAQEIARTGRSVQMDSLLASGSVEDVEAEHLARGRDSSPSEVLAWWWTTVQTLTDALRRLPTDRRLPWGPVTMSALSFATARLMETWAHGLDCFDAVGADPVDTARLHHVAHLGLRSLPYALAIRGLPPPGPVRLELTAPDGQAWGLGDDAAPTVIVGTAGDWCRVAVRRDRRGERARLRGSGPDAEAVIENAQAYLSAERSAGM